MKKFYIKCGSNQTLLLAHNPLQAAMLSFSKWTSCGVEEVSGSITVSERGFEKHDDENDFNYHIYDILMLVRKNNRYLIKQKQKENK